MSRRWVPALLWLAVIFTATSIPNPDVPAVPGGDKAAHAIMYGVLAALVGFALDVGGRSVTRLLLAFVALAGLAAADEWHQKLIPGRSGSVGDWIADVAGAAVTLLAAGAVWRRRETR